MAASDAKTTQQPTSATPAYVKLHRACLAGCIVLGPLVVLLGFVFDPTGGVPPAISGIIADFQAVSPLRIQLFLFFNAATPFFFPLSYLGLGLLALRRAPWLSTTGIIVGLVGSLPFAVFVVPEALVAAMAQLGGSNTANVALWQSTTSQGAIVFLQFSWVIGHLLGYVLLGIALGRARAIPLWAACLIALGAPFQAAAYPTHQGVLQILGFALVVIGSIPAALATLKRAGARTPAHPDEEPVPAA
ncbi:MAG TPA: hypothetical protein VH590_18820 [Ktedonobacterales bacterium]